MANKNSKEYKERYEVIENENGELETKFKTVFNEKGEAISKEKAKIKSGKLSRAAGARFELNVRKDLEEKGWIIDKWTNNVEFEKEENNQEDVI